MVDKTKEVIVDALPYIDSEYDEPGMKEMVMNMIEEEKRRYRPTKNYLGHLPPLELHRFETDVMKKEFERMLQRAPMEVLSMKRYELPPPPSGKLTDITAWNECLDNSYAQLEHQAIRICNLELMQEYGSEAWKSYLAVVSTMVNEAQKQLADIKRQIQEINWNRKSCQLQAGDQLSRLESSWVGLISKNYEIEQACLAREAIKYDKSAEKAQLEFILSDSETDRSGARQRRRLRRYFLQKHPQNAAPVAIIEATRGDDEQPPPPPPRQSEETPDERMEVDEQEVHPRSLDQEASSEEESESDEDEIGPQPLEPQVPVQIVREDVYPDSDKIENDPERAAESDDDEEEGEEDSGSNDG